MESSPVVPPSCSLDQSERGVQLARYRRVGDGARVLERSGRRLVVAVDDAVLDREVSDLVDVERACCPFFDLGWSPARRTLSVGVSSSDHEPALDAIAFALGLAD
jgi:hypothetical protein